MHVRIGRDLEGTPTTIDSTEPRAFAFLGDPGMGKSTLARYLVRWWLARTDERVAVQAGEPSEWSDLAGCNRMALSPLHELEGPRDSTQGTGLLVVDGLSDLGDVRDLVAAGEQVAAMVVVTAQTAWVSLASATGLTRYGLVVQSGPHPAGSLSLGIPDPTQTRLDWGADTHALLPDRRGCNDFPVHRWRRWDGAPRRRGARA